MCEIIYEGFSHLPFNNAINREVHAFMVMKSL